MVIVSAGIFSSRSEGTETGGKVEKLLAEKSRNMVDGDMVSGEKS
jgi:hypothetical protein